MSKAKGFFLAGMAGTFWGITGVVGQFLFTQKEMVPTWLVSYRLLSAGAILLLFLKMTKKDVTSVLKEKKDRNLLLVYSVVGMMLVQFSFFKAVETSNAGTATVLQYLNPAMMLVFFAFAKKIMPRKNEFIAVIMALVGIFFVSTGGDLNSLTLSGEGLFWGMACAVATCIYSIVPLPLLRKYDATVICGWGMLFGGVVLTAITRPWTISVPIDIEVIGSMVFLVIFGTILPFSFSLIAMPVIGPIHTNLLSSVEPIVAAIIAFWLLDTVFSSGEILGFVLIIGTIFVLALSREKG